MLHDTEIRSDVIADEWAVRSEFWQAEARKSDGKRRVRERNSRPLILTGHGTSLRIESGALSIKQGFTHYPQKAEQFRFFKGDLNLPQMIMLLDGSGSISFDVLTWLGEQGVALARIQWGGEPAVFASGAGFVLNSEKLRWQYETQANEQLDTLIYLWRCLPDCDSIGLSDGGLKCRHSVAFSISTSGMQPCRRRAIRWRSWAV